MAKKYGIIIDLKRCIGCNTCVIACKLENNIETEKSWITVGTVGKENFAIPGTLGYDNPQGRYPDLQMYYLPILCNHCSNPPCITKCKKGAIKKREDGIVLIDKDKCDGCKICIQACPYGVLTYNYSKEVMEKCTFCVHRIDKGLLPFCVTCCPVGAIIFGDLNDPNSEVSVKISTSQLYHPIPQPNTGPSVFYCSP